MRVFMLGWEFPPQISGGLGTACYGLTRALDEIGVEVCFVMPRAAAPRLQGRVKVRALSDMEPRRRRNFRHLRMHRLEAHLQAYASPRDRRLVMEQELARQCHSAPTRAAPTADVPEGSFDLTGADYEGDLFGQVYKYARLSVELARQERFDVIHAHDWMTYPAALAVAAMSRKPLVVHVHSTELDRCGVYPDARIYEIERTGMLSAEKVVCVSYLARSMVTGRYKIPAEKVEVVYNSVNLPADDHHDQKPIRRDEKIVLFLGRLTVQKGPEYFLQAAKKVVEKIPNVRFVAAGAGDMIIQCIRKARALDISKYVTFTGFLEAADVAKVFRMADLYVMPSVSEPFGIATLEALSHDVPVIVSRQSGVAEALQHVLKVDFWDVDDMANKIVAVLRHPPLQRALRQQSRIELRKFSWSDAAEHLSRIYDQVIGQATDAQRIQRK